jgi:hypothetical protein
MNFLVNSVATICFGRLEHKVEEDEKEDEEESCFAPRSRLMSRSATAGEEGEEERKGPLAARAVSRNAWRCAALAATSLSAAAAEEERGDRSCLMPRRCCVVVVVM